MKYLFGTIFICWSLCSFLSCTQSKKVEAIYDIVPLPQNIEKGDDNSSFIIDKSTQVVYVGDSERSKTNALLLVDYIKQNTGLKLSITDKDRDSGTIVLKTENTSSNAEAYSLVVSQNKIIIDGSSDAGVFYGIQTLRKSIPADENISSVEFKAVKIDDFPRFNYRGALLDVARHMFSTDSVKIFIDMLALHNINRFHWHLTDDQGWRIEIKKFPELSTISSMRDQTVIGINSGVYDNKPHGGFYTQEEIKEIVKYAKDRFITIIPEIDIPGHTISVLAAYPHLGCTGGPYKVGQKWGVSEDVLCAGNEEVYPFLESVFDEVIDLFPSEYIHIGGDECPKVRWKTCHKCQSKIKNLGLKTDKGHTAEERLQSYVIQRVEKYLNGKGRKIIGWDEILEGGIAPNATIMSWRGVEGGVAAARQGHDAIMSPNSHLYLDYYQSYELYRDPTSFGIRPVVSVEQVYSYEPMDTTLTESEKKHIIGVQGNLWGEGISNFKYAQYMALPRMAALSEIQWTMPDKKNYDNFLYRLSSLAKLYKHYRYNYATHVFNIKDDIVAEPESRQLKVALSTFDNAPIYYTTDGSVPDENSHQYDKPFIIKEDTNVKAIAIREKGVDNSKIYDKDFTINKATFKPIILYNQPNEKHTYGGAPVLVNGLFGKEFYLNGSWLGFDKDFVATIDMQEVLEITSLSLGTFTDPCSHIFNTGELIVEVSKDNKNFDTILANEYESITDPLRIGSKYEKVNFAKVEARFVKVTAKLLRKFPKWYNRTATEGALFVDEIEIN